MKYTFQTFNGTERRPLIPLVLRAVSASPLLDGLVDSGSDDTILNAELASALGISLNKCPRVPLGGIGSGQQIGYRAEVTFVFEDLKYEYTSEAVFAAIPHFSVILGQNDFFQHFNVLFEASKGTFTVTRAKLKS